MYRHRTEQDGPAGMHMEPGRPGQERVGKTDVKRDRIRRFKFFISYQKERKWLEDMALEGWFLEDMALGMIFTFIRGEPKRLLYDIDRFNLPKKPTLEEIQHKELFMEMAQEMGWREVTHDEVLTYYFAKEYEEGGVNELHNDPESRRYRADKFRLYLWETGKKLTFWSMVMALVDIFRRLILLLENEETLLWFDWFVLGYVVICGIIAAADWRVGNRCMRELSLTRQEWEESIDPATHKSVWKLIFTAKSLKQFLHQQAQEGWVLTSVTPVRYYFEKQDSANWVYAMDSKWLVNKRKVALNQEKIEDEKDWTGINNDWQLQSVHDAEEKGWTFVCALENRGIIYKGEGDAVQPLNDEKYDRKLRWISLIGEYGFYLLICGLLGGIIGFIAGILDNL